MSRRKRSKTKQKNKINPNRIKVRDYFLLSLILGATKSGFHRTTKKDPGCDWAFMDEDDEEE